MSMQSDRNAVIQNHVGAFDDWINAVALDRARDEIASASNLAPHYVHRVRATDDETTVRGSVANTCDWCHVFIFPFR